MEALEQVKDALRTLSSDWKIGFLPIPGVQISSSEIRRRIRLQRSIKYLVPEAVENYIKEHRLYEGMEAIC